MRKVKVDIEVLYGYDCMGRCHENNKSLTIEVSDDCANLINAIISKAGEKSIEKWRLEKIVELGNPELIDLQSKIEENCKTMDIKYWLDNCEDDGGAFVDSMYADLEDGAFVPSITKDNFIREFIEENNVPENEVEDYEDAIDDAYFDIVYDEYDTWVNEQDLYVQAEKHGLDTETCGDMSDFQYYIYVED